MIHLDITTVLTASAVTAAAGFATSAMGRGWAGLSKSRRGKLVGRLRRRAESLGWQLRRSRSDGLFRVIDRRTREAVYPDADTRPRVSFWQAALFIVNYVEAN